MPLSRITSASIANSAVAAADIADGTITAAKIVSIANTQITGNIVSSQITSVGGSQITSNTVANSAFQTGSVENYLNAQSLYMGMRNKIINGAMVIDQRNNGANVTYGTGSSTSDNYTLYSLDRWYGQSYQSAANKGGTFVVQRNGGSVTPPTGFTNYLRAIVTYAQADVATDSSLYRITHKIEANNLAGSGWGTAAAQSMTLSFWVRSSLTGQYTIHLDNDVDLNYTTTYTINSANTWEKKVLVIPGPTTGAWPTTTSVALNMDFTLAASTGRTGGTLNSWLADTKQSATGSVNWMATLGNTYHLTGVQFEIGSQATPFEFRQYGTELQLCQRYYNKLVSGTGTNTAWGGGMFASSTSARVCVTYPVMRVSPTVSFYSIAVNDTQARISITASQGGYIGTSSFMNDYAVASGGTTYRPILITTDGDTTGYIALTAEL